MAVGKPAGPPWRALRTALTLTQGFLGVGPPRDRGADLQNYPVLFSFAQGETKAERTCDLLGVVQQVESTAEAVTLTPESKPQS